MCKRVLPGSVALAAGLLVGTLSRPAIGQELSPGCQLVNKPFTTLIRSGGGLGMARQFFTGETITVAAGTPSLDTPTTLTLRVNGREVDTAAFPGEVSYTFPADATVSVDWLVDGGATFTVRCDPAPALPTSIDECKKGGYVSFGFKNQGDCVSFIATDGKNEPAS